LFLLLSSPLPLPLVLVLGVAVVVVVVVVGAAVVVEPVVHVDALMTRIGLMWMFLLMWSSSFQFPNLSRTP
jgi:hypothetical protein